MATNDLVIVSWDDNNINDGTNYKAGFFPGSEWGLPGVQVEMIQRVQNWPQAGSVTRDGRRLQFFVRIVGANVRSLRDDLLSWFDPEDETPKALVIEDSDGSDDRYVNAVCESCKPWQQLVASDVMFLVTLAIHGDVRWRSTSAVQDIWSITGSGETNVVANDGTDDAFPKFTIKPTSALTGGYPYKVFIPVRWRVSKDHIRYPVDIVNNGLDTATLIGAAKMQADGDDLRVENNGVEIDRWLQDINDATTQVWCNLDFKAKQEATLATAIADAGAITTIDVNESIKHFPSNGILMIGTEAFSYTGKTDIDKQFTGVTRTINGTSIAAHAVDDAVWWCQHNLWIKYGDATASAPDVDDDYKPAFELTSTNTSWVYAAFGDDNGKRTGAWYRTPIKKNPSFYTANQGTDASPWTDIGVHTNSYAAKGMWCLYNPCGVTNANFTNGEKYSTLLSDWNAGIYSSKTGRWPWTSEYAITAPSSTSSWEAWSRNEALTTGSRYVSIFLRSLKDASYEHKLEVADVTVTLDNTVTPTLTIGSEAGAYTMSCTIENQTTSESISIEYHLAVNDELEVDTDAHTVTDLQTDLSQLQALTLDGGARKNWLLLQPGNNTLAFTATGTNAVTMTTEWYKRWY